MSLTPLVSYCRKLPHVVEDIKWDNNLCFSILDGRLFCVFAIENKIPVRVSFKVETHRFLELTDQAPFIPAPYMARAHWVAVVDYRSVAMADLKAMVKTSYALYFAKLSKKKQRELTG